MSSPPDAVPIPEQISRRRTSIVQSSLDIVFSYSRSQQNHYGQVAGSAPSFINSRSQSSTSDYGSSRRRRQQSGPDGEFDETDEDEIREESDEEGVLEEEDQDTPKRRPSDIPGVFEYGDEDIDTSTTSGSRSRDDLEASVSTITPLKVASSSRRMLPPPSSILGSSSGSRGSFSGTVGSRLVSSASQSVSGRASYLQRSQTSKEDLSPTDPDPEVLDEATPLRYRNGDEAGSKARRRSSTVIRRPGDAAGERLGSAMSARRGSMRSRRKSVVLLESGKSTDGQTLFNGVAVLVGIGLLSLPLAFAYAGWIGGTIMLVGFAALTCYTAKLLARLIRADPTLRGYTDIGKKAFGTWASGAINVLFCLELFALGVALIVLFGDSLNVIYPDTSADTFKMIGFLIVLPTALLPLSLLSLPSLLSTLSSLLLVAIILVDGISKPSAPGSLRDPSPTNFGPEWQGANWLGGIGLVLAGFGGHAVMPSLARDMKHPERFDKVINRAFIIATIISFVAGAAGYLMIGQGVSDEITRDLMQPKYGYPRWLNLFALWMIVINPVTKFGLCSRPLNLTLETVLGISEGSTTTSSVDSDTTEPNSATESTGLLDSISPTTSLVPDYTKSRAETASGSDREAKLQSSERKKFLARVISRTVVTGLCTTAAIYLPGFGRVMAFLGSFSAFLICCILPLLFYLFLAPRLNIDPDMESGARRRNQVFHWMLVLVSVVFMVAGTTWAFIPGSGHGGLED